VSFSENGQLALTLQWPALVATRGPTAHGRDVRPVAALL
jgi:hypothetical protein